MTMKVMDTPKLLPGEGIKQESNCEAVSNCQHEMMDPDIESKQGHDSETTINNTPQAVQIKLEPDDDDDDSYPSKKDRYDDEDKHVSPVTNRARINTTSSSSQHKTDHCEKCQMKYEGDCPEHGPVICVDNTEIAQRKCRYSKEVRTLAQVAGNKAKQGQETGGEFGEHSSDKNNQQISEAESLQKAHENRFVGRENADASLGVVHYHCGDNVNNSVDLIADNNEKTLVDNGGESEVAELNMSEDCITDHVMVKDNCEIPNDDLGMFVNGGFSAEPDKMFSGCEMNIQFNEMGASGKSRINWNSKKYRKMLNSNRRFKCDICGVGFHRGSDLSKHNRTHTGEKPYKCDICGTGFAQSSPLKTHKRIHTGEKPYKCDVCGVGFYNGSHLKTHSRIHTGEKPYKCDVCGVGFSDCSHLRTHNRIHTGEKPYKCDVCEVRFAQCSDLRRHVRIHTGEKPYKCEFCGVGFAQSSPLVKHKRIHTGEKPYKCEVCGAGFTGCSDLKQHIRTHTGEKPYKCDICGVGFVGGSVLKKHKRTHTREKPHKCDVCGVGFTRGSDLKSHKRVHAITEMQQK